MIAHRSWGLYHPSLTVHASSPHLRCPCTRLPTGVDADKIRVIPVPIDTELFNPENALPATLPMGELIYGHARDVDEAARKAGKGPFVFFSNFKFENRKGWDILLQAYLEVRGARAGSLDFALTHMNIYTHTHTHTHTHCRSLTGMTMSSCTS
jgi:glycosyltransferase involved in cell wall biosynthesis